jgi:hypothetical protein
MKTPDTSPAWAILLTAIGILTGVIALTILIASLIGWGFVGGFVAGILTAIGLVWLVCKA